jgi:hypothetical protein
MTWHTDIDLDVSGMGPEGDDEPDLTQALTDGGGQ